MTAVCEPTTEGNGRDLQSAFAHKTVLHLGQIFGCFGLRHVAEWNFERQVLDREKGTSLIYIAIAS